MFISGVIVYDYELKIGWGKSVALPSQALPAPPPGHMAIRNKEVVFFCVFSCCICSLTFFPHDTFASSNGMGCFWCCTQELPLMILFFFVFMQGGTVVLSGPGGPAVASVTPQTSELVGEVAHKSLMSSSAIFLGCHFLSFSVNAVILLFKLSCHSKRITIESSPVFYFELECE